MVVDRTVHEKGAGVVAVRSNVLTFVHDSLRFRSSNPPRQSKANE